MTAPATSPDSPATEAKAPPFGESIALLGGYVRPRLATICLGIFLGLLGTGVGLASPLATKWVLDTLGTPTSPLTPRRPSLPGPQPRRGALGNLLRRTGNAHHPGR